MNLTPNIWMVLNKWSYICKTQLFMVFMAISDSSFLCVEKKNVMFIIVLIHDKSYSALLNAKKDLLFKECSGFKTRKANLDIWQTFHLSLFFPVYTHCRCVIVLFTIKRQVNIIFCGEQHNASVHKCSLLNCTKLGTFSLKLPWKNNLPFWRITTRH